MELIGEIVREPDPPGVSRQSWIDLIRDHPNLVSPRTREGTNPFTKKKPMVIRPRPGVARVVVDGNEVGSMSWAEDDSNQINVYGGPQSVVPLAREVAQSLGACFRGFTGGEQR